MARKAVFLIRGMERARVKSLLKSIATVERADAKNAIHNAQFPDDEKVRFVDENKTKKALETLQLRCTELLARQT